MRSFAFLTAFLLLAYGAIAAMDESGLSDLTREVLQEQRTKVLNRQPPPERNIIATLIPGSITIVYHTSTATPHLAIQVLNNVKANIRDTSVEHNAYLIPGCYPAFEEIELPRSQLAPRQLDKDTLVAIFTPGCISVLHHHEMELKTIHSILAEALPRLSRYATLHRDYRIAFVYQDGLTKLESLNVQ